MPLRLHAHLCSLEAGRGAGRISVLSHSKSSFGSPRLLFVSYRPEAGHVPTPRPIIDRGELDCLKTLKAHSSLRLGNWPKFPERKRFLRLQTLGFWQGKGRELWGRG